MEIGKNEEVFRGDKGSKGAKGDRGSTTNTTTNTNTNTKGVYIMGKDSEKEDSSEEKKGKKKLLQKFSFQSFGQFALGGALIAGAALFFMNRQSTVPVSNVDTLSLIKKVNEENRKQTQEIVNQLAKEIKQLTLAVKQQQEVLAKQQSAPLKKQEKKQIENLKKKLEAYEKKAELKREQELQKALLKQYIEETRRRESRSVSLAVEVEEVKKPAVKKKSYLHRVYIPTGSVAAGVTMHSIPAPVERGVLPLPPVLIRLTGEAYTSNGFSVPLDDCYMVGKAQGDWNFIGGEEYARAEIQLDKLICVLGNGKVIEKKVNAYVIDRESGMNGLIGRKLDISGEQIAKFTAINTLSSFWSGLAKSYTETTTTNDGYTFEKVTKPAKYALFSSLSKSWDKFTKFYEQRLSKIYPVVVVPANRKLEVVFLSGVDLGVTDEELTRWGI